MKTSSGSGMAGMVMVGFVLVAALTLGVALAPTNVVAGGDFNTSDCDETQDPCLDPSPSPDFDED